MIKRLMAIILIASVFVLPSGAAASFGKPSIPVTPRLTFDEAAEWAIRFDGIYAGLPDELKHGVSTQNEIGLWTLEVVPMFEYEGIDGPGALRYPASFTFEYYQGGLEHNHILGQTRCLSGEVTLNARFSNPESSMYDHIMSLGTLVHELAHLQGICFGDRLDAENSAQLVMLEILASLTTKGNEQAFASLMFELGDMAMTAAEWAATQEGRLDDYHSLEKKLESPFQQARSDKSRRFWQSDPGRRDYIIETYNFIPMQELWKALNSDDTIQGVDLPINHACKYTSYVSYSGDQYSATEPCEGEPLVVDDLAYVFAHAEELAGSI